MIRLENIPRIQTIYVPKGKPIPSGATLALNFKSTVDLSAPSIAATVTDIGNLKYYYIFAIAVGVQGDFNVDFNEDFYTWMHATPGEYEYTLSADGVEVAHGVAIVGNYEASKKTYSKEIQYKQYEG